MKRVLLLIGILIFSKVFAYTDLSAEDFKKMMGNKDVVIIDVRTPEEYEKDGHIKGANLIPVQIFRYIYLPGLRNKKVLVYCRSGNRSVTASRMLEQMGIKNVYNLKGGIIEWKSKKLPVEFGWK